jgi:hypothetical protein
VSHDEFLALCAYENVGAQGVVRPGLRPKRIVWLIAYTVHNDDAGKAIPGAKSQGHERYQGDARGKTTPHIRHQSPEYATFP